MNSMLYFVLAFGASTGQYQEHTNILSLIKPTIKAVQCATKCAVLTHQEDRNRCVEVCTADDSENLCRYSWLCGEACRLACAEVEEEGHRRLVSLDQVECQFTWQTNRQATPAEIRPVNFIALAQDKAEMWRVIGSPVSESRLRLTSSQTQMFSRLMVVAVSEKGVEDVKNVPVYSSSSCTSVNSEGAADKEDTTTKGAVIDPESASDDLIKTPDNSAVNQTLFFILSLCCICLSCTALMIYLLYSCSTKQENSTKVQNFKLAQIAKPDKIEAIFVIEGAKF